MNKKNIFNEADKLYIQAREAYEIGNREDGADYENRFKMLLNQMIRMGIDREYMGIV